MTGKAPHAAHVMAVAAKTRAMAEGRLVVISLSPYYGKKALRTALKSQGKSGKK
jgi:hypothetical protein